MTRAEAATALRAAGWTAAAAIGWRDAVALLQEVAKEIEAAQWKDAR